MRYRYWGYFICYYPPLYIGDRCCLVPQAPNLERSAPLSDRGTNHSSCIIILILMLPGCTLLPQPRAAVTRCCRYLLVLICNLLLDSQQLPEPRAGSPLWRRILRRAWLSLSKFLSSQK
ncbi:hypothetical protein BDV11DRAFT_191324 [Aspergillus similis]